MTHKPSTLMHLRRPDTSLIAYHQVPSASIAIYDDEDTFLGIAVDEDAMALIKRDGVRALVYPIIEAVQRNRPVCSITDSPFVVLNIMRNEGWDRVGVSKHGKMIGVVHRRHLVSFFRQLSST